MPDLCASADLGAIVQISGFVDEVGERLFLRLSFAGFDHRSLFHQRTLAGVQNIQDPQSFPAIGQRRGPRSHTVKEMLALGLERLAMVQSDILALRFDGRGYAVLPFHLVGIQHQFVLGGVIKHRHLFRTDNHQPLLFERMKPAHKNVRVNAAGKLKLTERDVEDIAIQMRAALAGNPARLFIQQGQNHRDVMRRKAPQNVLFRPNLADVQPVRI